MRRSLFAFLMCIPIGLCCGAAAAAQLTIVALGASNTEGTGVGKAKAFPSQLEAMLRQRGIDARVVNLGSAGDTTEDMLHRLDSVIQQHPQAVILQPGGNDFRKGGTREQRSANIQQIMARLKAQGIRVLVVNPPSGMPATVVQPDGIHLNEQGHAMLASQLAAKLTSGSAQDD